MLACDPAPQRTILQRWDLADPKVKDSLQNVGPRVVKNCDAFEINLHVSLMLVIHVFFVINLRQILPEGHKPEPVMLCELSKTLVEKKLRNVIKINHLQKQKAGNGVWKQTGRILGKAAK